MNERELRELIRQVIGEMAGPGNQGKPANRALVLFTGALIGFEESLEQLAVLSENGWVLEAVFTDSARRIVDLTRVAELGVTDITGQSMAAHKLLLVPTMTVNTVAKVAHGIGDSLATNLIADFIMNAKPVIAAVDGACPDSPGKRGWFPNLPEGYAAMLRANLAALKSFGVTLCPASKLAARALALDGEIIGGVVGEQTVKALIPGAVLRVSKKTLVTALARDLAAARGIRIERSE